MTSVALPSLELKLKKEINTSLTNTNTNTINNIINLSSEPAKKELSAKDISSPPVPDHITRFKEALLLILISYFKNNIVLLNNLIELSDSIIMKMEDLIFLISILLQISEKSDVKVDVEDIETKSCCGRICSKLPRYRKINDIIIKNKSSFKVAYNQYYVQMMTEYNISMDYAMN
jgi:hypothetical protein